MTRELTDEMRESIELINDTVNTGKVGTARVHISVLDDGEWVGDFWATFNRQERRDGVNYVADWSDVSGGNGIYVDDDPTFWPVEVAAERLNELYDISFKALDTGPNDI